MKKSLLLFVPLLMLTGCETIQSPQQRRQADARQLQTTRYMEEQVRRLRSQVEAMEMENGRLMQEMQQLKQDLNAYSSRISQLNSNVQALESKQAREMNELIARVERLLKKTVASRPAQSSSSSKGPGREHVVESGHTLSAIASAYGTTVKAIKQANNLKSDSIYVGQKLFIPE